eukprot:SAG31_NODE_2492_length_5611_cov_8.589078_2_plen_472_part_00
MAPTAFLGTLVSMPRPKFDALVARAQYYHDGDDRWMIQAIDQIPAPAMPEPESNLETLPQLAATPVHAVETPSTLPSAVDASANTTNGERPRNDFTGRKTFIAPGLGQQTVGIIAAAGAILTQIVSTKQLALFFDEDLERSCQDSITASKMCLHWHQGQCSEWAADHNRVATLLEYSCNDVCDAHNDTEDFLDHRWAGRFKCDTSSDICVYKYTAHGDLGNLCERLRLPECCVGYVNFSRLYLALAALLSVLGFLLILGVEGAIRLLLNSLVCCVTAPGSYYHDSMVNGYHELLESGAVWSIEQIVIFVTYRLFLLVFIGSWWTLFDWEPGRASFDDGSWSRRVWFTTFCYVVCSVSSLYAMWIHADKPPIIAQFITPVFRLTRQRRVGVGVENDVHQSETSNPVGGRTNSESVIGQELNQPTIVEPDTNLVHESFDVTATAVDGSFRPLDMDQARQGWRVGTIVHVEEMS